jgi:hypothetical protein
MAAANIKNLLPPVSVRYHDVLPQSVFVLRCGQKYWSS